MHNPFNFDANQVESFDCMCVRQKKNIHHRINHIVHGNLSNHKEKSMWFSTNTQHTNEYFDECIAYKVI